MNDRGPAFARLWRLVHLVAGVGGGRVWAGSEGVKIEVIPAAKINEAYDRVLASDVRYRFVINAATFA